MHSFVVTFYATFSLSRADNAVIYSSLSIKNIIPNQKPIIPQASSDYAQALCVPLPLLLPLSLSLSVNLAHHQSCCHAKRRRGRAAAQRHCHGKSKYYFFFLCVSFSSIFACRSVIFVTVQTLGTTYCQLSHVCVCVCGCMFVCVCAVVGCGP